MKIKVNRNIIWTDIFLEQLVKCGVKYACISPGSRSTPLTYNLAKNKNIRSYVNIDERSSAFFALGLAKRSKTPVLIVTTSGTAVAEIYPAIIEAYQNRVPLIVCTADRPSFLRNTGANQTINQDNIFRNHIRFFYDAGLPELKTIKLKKLKENAIKAFNISLFENRGPVHLNFQFEKPFEPLSYTDSINENFLKALIPKNHFQFPVKDKISKSLSDAGNEIKNSDSVLIIVGPGDYPENFANELNKLSEKLSAPVLADGASGLRFKNKKIKNLITNFDAILRNEEAGKFLKVDVVIQFGRNFSSKKTEQFLSSHSRKRIIVNEFGDRYTAVKKGVAILKIIPESFPDLIFSMLDSKRYTKVNYLNKWIELDSSIEQIKIKMLHQNFNEAGIIRKIFEMIPDRSQVMIGNSLPVRDLDYFVSSQHKSFTIYQNRGASGIDGVTSTALGLSAVSSKTTFLITGDLSFLYDLNAFLIAKKYDIPLVIFVINNSGGGIFNFLPVAEYQDVFEEYFRTPQNVSIEKLVKAFDINFYSVKSFKDLEKIGTKISKLSKLTVVEIGTDSDFSYSVRMKYWDKVTNFVNKFILNYEA